MSKTRPKAAWWSFRTYGARPSKEARLIERKGQRRLRQREAERQIRDEEASR